MAANFLLQPGKRLFDTPAPPNYVAGLGRGATGFTTRSDIGPARMTLDMPQMPPGGLSGIMPPPAAVAPTGYVAGMGRGAGGAAPSRGADGDENEDLSESNYDEFEGYGGGFVDPTTPYDQDDKEADDTWESIDERMDSKRKIRRETKEKEALSKFRAERPKIQQQFSDLRRELSGVSYDDWENLPEPGDFRRTKRQMVERYMPAPDSLLEKARAENEQFSSLDVRQQKLGGLETPGGRSGLSTPLGMVTPDLKEYGDKRKLLLEAKLKGVSDSVSGQTVVDPKGYLTDLSSVKVTSDAEIGDLKKAGLLLKSVITTNPKHPPGWIAAARLEEIAGKIVQARKIIAKGCEECPDNEDVWIENARLQTPENAKIVISQAVKHIPNSVKLWMYAANLETDTKAKQRVLRKGLEFIPNSVRLWKAAVELEEPENARILLSRAVECVPDNVEMWLALARLETYDKAKVVLNKAIRAIPGEPQIWITAAMLEEAHNANEEKTRDIIKKGVKALQGQQVIFDREQWIKEAEKAEKAGMVHTSQSIISETIGTGLEEEDRKKTWIEDAESCIAHGSIQTARAIYAHALTVFPGKKSLWLRNAHLEKAHGTKESLDQLLKKAVRHCPQAEILWLMGAKEKWMSGDVDGARQILRLAFEANPDSEQIWLAAVKLESENKEFSRARSLLERARERSGTQRVWLKSAILEREMRNFQEEKRLLTEGLLRYANFDKLWMMRAQFEEREKNWNLARDIYLQGLRNCPKSITLWKCAASLEEKAGSSSKARAILDKARLQNPKNPDLWLMAIRVELRANNKKMAQAALAKALQECPNSGILWAEAIEMEPAPQQKAKSVDALKRCDNDPHVIIAVAKVFWRDRKVDKTRTWLNRAVTLNPDLGDAWANFYKFEVQHGTEEQQREIIRRCTEAEPHHGEKWTQVSKAVENSGLKTEQILKMVALTV